MFIIKYRTRDVLYGQTEVRDLGPPAAWRVDEFDWASLQSGVVFDLPSFGAVLWNPAT